MSRSQEIAAAIQSRIEQFADEMEVTIAGAGALLEQGIRARASLDDHTLAELAALGHPYRQTEGSTYGRVTKAGKWTAGISRVPRIIREGILGHDIKLVHTQSGTLLSAIYTTLERTDEAIWVKVGVDPAVAPYIEYVIKGTSHMIPRDFIGAAAVATKSQVMALVRTGINAAARVIGAQ
jgi:hypothetical protein